MRIIRFLDEQRHIHFGHEHPGGGVTLLDGDPVHGVKETGRLATVTKLLAPVEPRVILCIGLNYRKHAEETGAKIPSLPVLFAKNPASVNNPGDAIVIPRCCKEPTQVDYEVELAVVIGRTATNVRREDAMQHIAGYTIGNDVSARHWQKALGGSQWVRGKSFDTFCPLGPALITPDDLPDPQALRLTTRVNGELRQDSSTADMIFPVDQLIEFLSDGMTLLPGTVILTGTPSGVGMGMVPPKFLQPGDTLELAIDRIGTLSNPITTE